MRAKCESATERLIMRANEDRLARLDALMAALEALLAQHAAETDAMARRFFLLEHRLGLLEEAAEYWGLRKAPRDA